MSAKYYLNKITAIVVEIIHNYSYKLWGNGSYGFVDDGGDLLFISGHNGEMSFGFFFTLRLQLGHESLRSR